MGDNTEAIKDIILAEYASLRNLSIQREGAQNTIIGWLMGLVGAFIGLNIANIPPSEMNNPLILSYLFCPDKEIIALFVFICTGFTLGIELLLSYWIYNRYCMLLINSYILLIEARLRKSLNIGDELDILSWERMSPKKLLLSEKLSGKSERILKFFILKIAFLQPFPLYFFSIIGIGLIATGVCKTESYILITFFWFLLIGLFIQIFIHILLWVYSNPNICIEDLKS